MSVTLSPDAAAYLAQGMGDRTARVPDGPRHREASQELQRVGFLGYRAIRPGGPEYQYITAEGAQHYTAGINA